MQQMHQNRERHQKTRQVQKTRQKVEEMQQKDRSHHILQDSQISERLQMSQENNINNWKMQMQAAHIWQVQVCQKFTSEAKHQVDSSQFPLHSSVKNSATDPLVSQEQKIQENLSQKIWNSRHRNRPHETQEMQMQESLD